MSIRAILRRLATRLGALMPEPDIDPDVLAEQLCAMDFSIGGPTLGKQFTESDDPACRWAGLRRADVLTAYRDRPELAVAHARLDELVAKRDAHAARQRRRTRAKTKRATRSRRRKDGSE